MVIITIIAALADRKLDDLFGHCVPVGRYLIRSGVQEAQVDFIESSIDTYGRLIKCEWKVKKSAIFDSHKVP